MLTRAAALLCALCACRAFDPEHCADAADGELDPTCSFQSDAFIQRKKPGGRPGVISVTLTAEDETATEGKDQALLESESRSSAQPAPLAPLAPGASGLGLLAHYRFEEPMGTRTCQDASGNGRHLAFRSMARRLPTPEMQPGRGLAGGGGVRFFMRSTAKSVVPIFRTASLWLKRDVGCCSRMKSFFRAHRRESKTQFMEIYHNHVRFTSAAGVSRYVKFKNVIATNETQAWQHMAFTVHDDKLVAYLDGERVGEVQGDLSDMGSEDLDFTLGLHIHHPFLGVMDEVRLYSSILDDGAISALAASEARGGLLQSEKGVTVDAGPPITIWRPETFALLEGHCGGPAHVHARWEYVKTPWWSKYSLVQTDGNEAGLSLSDLKLEPQAQGPQTVRASLPSQFPTGDYVFRLTCTAGTETRYEEVSLSLFEAHENKAGQTFRTVPITPNGLETKGQQVKPVALFLFDGSAKDEQGGPDAEGKSAIPHKPDQPLDFQAEGKFGGSLRLKCSHVECTQLRLGNPESAPWPAMTVSFWFKKSKRIGNVGHILFQKGAFKSRPNKLDGNVWHHYVETQDGTARKVYVDGLLVLFGSGLQRGASDAADFMSFGARNRYTSGYDGYIDELAIYDFIVSNDEVELIYTNGAKAFTQRLDANPYWRGGYSTNVLREYFSDVLPQNPSFEGYFRKNPQVEPPRPYVHPRVFFTPEELPELRRRLRSSTAARVGMEYVRGLLKQFFPYEKMAKENLTQGSLNYYDIQDLIHEAFRCLIDNDRAGAEALGRQLHSLALEQKKILTEYQPRGPTWQMTPYDYDPTDTWRGHHHGAVLRLGTALMYDFLYPWLTVDTRNLVREVLTLATKGTWSIGMDAVPGERALTSNWLCWCTGDLILNMMAFEGEDGFDEGVYERAMQSYVGFVTLGVSRLSGALFEGGGKNSLTGAKLLAMASHGRPEFIAAEGTRKYVKQWLLNTMLPNGDFLEDDLWGGADHKPLPGDVMALKYAYPGDAIIDYVYRNAMQGGRRSHDHTKAVGLPYREAIKPVHMDTVYTYNPAVSAIVYALDHNGPEDLVEHGKTALRGQPLTFVAEDQGVLIARSAWADPDAAWLYFNVRSQLGGHAVPARGEFMFYALGQVWAHYTSGHNMQSHMHSVVLVDGKGQTVAPGKFLHYFDSLQASWGSCDLRLQYSQKPWGDVRPNDQLLNKGPYKWQDLPFRQQPNWYSGTLQSGGTFGGEMNFQKAFRTTGLVRSGASPYAFVFDDFQKDSAAHTYVWQMPLQPHKTQWNYQLNWLNLIPMDYSGVAPTGSDVVIPATNSKARLLVRLLPGSSAGKIEILRGNYLTITANEVSARFRVLLVPLREGEGLPDTQWDEASGKLTFSRAGTGESDVLQLAVSDQGVTTIASMELAGSAVAFTKNAISSR